MTHPARGLWTLQSSLAPYAAMLCIACGGTPTTPGTGPAAELVLQAGNGQSATVGTSVAIAPVVRALDVHGKGVPGVAVTFAPLAGSGAVEGVSSITTLTTQRGDAQVSWTLGTTAGPDTLRAISPGLTGSPITLTATGTAGPPTQIARQLGDGQQAVHGTAVAIAPSVRLTDQYTNPVPAVTVQFGVASGGGSVSGANQQTDMGGVATVGSWILGDTPGPGVNTLTATAAGNGISGNPVTFRASSVFWTSVANMQSAHVGLGAGVVNGVLYAVGGSGSAVVEAYDRATDTWSTKAPMPTARGWLAEGVVNGIVYAVGGRSVFNNSAIGTVEAYDPATNTWTAKAPMPTARYSLAVGVVNGVLYAIGGFGQNALGTVEAYDPATNTWTAKAPMPTARKALAVGVVNGIIYAVGGSGNSSPLGPVEAYDPATNTWTTKAPMPTPRDGLGAGVLNGVLYAVGGGGGGWLTTTEAYDPVTNSWTRKDGMPKPDSDLAVGVLNGLLYSVGGCGTCAFAYHP